MRPGLVVILPVLALAGCAELATGPAQPSAPVTPTASPEAPARVVPTLSAGASGRAPLSRPAAARPEAYDQSTAEQKAAAASPTGAEARLLGSTIASLGDPAQQGFWIRTPLVKTPAKGRLVDPSSGKSVNVDLIPRDGPQSAGSQVSLAAMQMLGVPLTGLPRLEVFAN